MTDTKWRGRVEVQNFMSEVAGRRGLMKEMESQSRLRESSRGGGPMQEFYRAGQVRVAPQKQRWVCREERSGPSQHREVEV